MVNCPTACINSGLFIFLLGINARPLARTLFCVSDNCFEDKLVMYLFVSIVFSAFF